MTAAWCISRSTIVPGSVYDEMAIAGTRTTLAWGMKDLAFREKELDRWRGLFRDARVVKYSDCGHFVAEERPDDLSREILAVSAG